MRAYTAADVYKRAGPINALTGRRTVYAPAPFQENVEVVGVQDFTLTGLELIGGSVGVRLNKCPMFSLTNLSISGMTNWLKPDGKWADDGHGIQIINSGGTIHYCWVSSDAKLWSEDSISIYGDEPATEAMHVIVELCRTYGRSQSPTCTHICIDGPHPPKVTVLQNRGQGARCFAMVAGGKTHDIQMNASYGADTDCFLDNYYDVPNSLDRITVERNIFPQGLLLGHGLGTHNKLQAGRQT